MTGLDAYLDQITENGKIIFAVYQRFLSQLTWEMLVGKKGPVNFKLGSEKKASLPLFSPATKQFSLAQ